MEFRVLQYFLAITREESISGAAEYLHISQPTLSRQIKDLEDELGTVLFERGSRKITLTEDGMLLRKRAEEIVGLVNKTESEIISRKSSLNGDIYIGCGETEGMSFIAKAIKRVQNIHSHITFHLHSGNAEDIIERLDKGLIDFGVLIGVQDVSKYHSIKLPIKDVRGVLMRKDSQLAHLKGITPKDLINQPLIVSAQELKKNQISEYLGNENYRIVATYNLIYNASLMVKEGIGYAIGLDRLINTDCSSDLCFIPLEPTIDAEIIFIWKKYQHFSKSSQYFLNTIQKILNEETFSSDSSNFGKISQI